MKSHEFIEDPTARIMPTIDSIKRDCIPFLTENLAYMSTEERFLYRGMKDSGNMMLPLSIKKITRTDRRPLDSSTQTHNMFNEAFQHTFGWPYRSASVFAFKSPVKAMVFGPVYIIFPIGEYTLLFSPHIADLTEEHEPLINKIIGNMPQSELVTAIANSNLNSISKFEITDHESVLDIINRSGRVLGPVQTFFENYIFPKFGYRETTKLQNITPKSEIMVACSSYYAISTAHFGAPTKSQLIALLNA